MRQEFDYIIVGAGLTGLALAKELSKKGKNILILEKGGHLKNLGQVMYAWQFYDKFALSKSVQGVIIYRTIGVGGTSIVSGGNAIEFSEDEYNKIGINLKEELNAAKEECRISITDFPIGRVSKRIMESANKLGYDMKIMPKFGRINKCVSCGSCTLGCKYGAKWTALEFLKNADKSKVGVITNFSVRKVIISNGKAIGIEGRNSKFIKQRFFSGKIILSAGGIGTPIILQNSGIEAGTNLYVDLLNVTYGFSKDLSQSKDVTMSVLCDKFHKDEGFILTPLLDNFFSFASCVEPRHIWKMFKLNKLLGVMTKIKDEDTGRVFKDGRIEKAPTQKDLEKLNRGSEISTEILIECGVNPKSIFVTRPRGAHPSGTAAIGRVVNNNLETKINNLYVCDASALPYTFGLPPVLTLIALAKWLGKRI